MRSSIWHLGSGLVFGLGLLVSGMTNPAKVQGFLDWGGTFDASLILVLGAAVLVHTVLFRLIQKRRAPLFDVRFHLPTRRDIDFRLLAGAAVFGAGWGVAGYCPGPGLVSLGGGMEGGLVFVLAMTVGMVIFQAVESARVVKGEPQPR